MQREEEMHAPCTSTVLKMSEETTDQLAENIRIYIFNEPINARWDPIQTKAVMKNHNTPPNGQFWTWNLTLLFTSMKQFIW